MSLSTENMRHIARELLREHLEDIDYSLVYEDEAVANTEATEEEMRTIYKMILEEAAFAGKAL